jgi:hypothetical protein
VDIKSLIPGDKRYGKQIKGRLLLSKAYLICKKLNKQWLSAIKASEKWKSNSTSPWHRPGIQRGQKGSGVTGGQMETAKYVEFRNVTASFFTRYVSDFHEKHQQSAL